MLFQSQGFILIFLPLAVASYYLTARDARGRQWTLILASLVFYGWWDVRFIPLLVSQIVISWLLAVWHEHTRVRAILIVGITLNLASLAIFKYLDFLIESFDALTGATLPRANVLLPIGISFFSFQLISYLVDRMRTDAPIYRLRQFALFVLLFPHLIAGPIVRHNELIPQFDLDPLREGLWRRCAAGLTLFTIGFAKKVFLADKLAAICDPVFSATRTSALTFAEAWSGALAFSFQLFLDFSAYTEMAIGIALLFGITLPENFNRPYLATDLREFWRRWHISLSRFIRDYLYIPLGGSRSGTGRYILATLGAMGLCGLWHGAGWTYVAWGLWHGFGLIMCHGWQRFGRPLPDVVGWIATMLFVLVGWVLFRSPDFSHAAVHLAAMSGLAGFGGNFSGTIWIIAGAFVSVALASAHTIKDRWLRPTPWIAGALAMLGVYCVLIVGDGAPVSFIYFRF